MIGAIIGDIVGSPYEFNENNIKTTEFPLFTDGVSNVTDDSIMTCAVADSLFYAGNSEQFFKETLIDTIKIYGNADQNASYGPRFRKWLFSDDRKPINSFGNGSAMRVSPVAWRYDNIADVLKYAKLSAEVTHDHPEGIKGAQAVASAIFLARCGKTKREIHDFIVTNFGYDLSKTCDEIRPDYKMDATCQGSVPQAIRAFLEGNTFEECIRLAVSLGGDSDTIACITGSIAEGYYNIPFWIKNKVIELLKKKRMLYSSYIMFSKCFINNV
jgi:ADP-ribosylglycohydrolase